MQTSTTGIAMKRYVALVIVVAASLWACDGPEDKKTTEEAAEKGWAAQVAFVESTGDAGIQVKAPGDEAFVAFVGGSEIATGSMVRTSGNTRARLAVEGAEVVVNHSTTLELVAEAERTIRVIDGQVVISTTQEKAGTTTVHLPTGSVVLHGTQVSAVAGEKFSTVSVSSGSVEVSGSAQALEARAGDEIVLPREGQPTVHSAPGLGHQFGWSELSDPEAREKIEVPRGLGKLVGKAPGGERERALELVEHNVESTVHKNIAYTEVEEKFRNPTSEVLEGVYRFPLPADAQITRLALDVNGKLMEGQFLETERAEWIWRDIINQSRDPAMLKWKQGNQFELRIFPIEAKSVRRVIIGYTQRLEPSAGGYRYVYPMPVDHAGTIPAEKFNFSATIAGHDPTGVFQVSGYDAKVAHEATEDDKSLTKVNWSQEKFVASGDLAIRYAAPHDENGFEAYRYDNETEDRGFFSVSIRPTFPRSEEVASRDLLLVVDRSYHQTGQALELQKRVIGKVLDEVDPLDRVSVMACATVCEPVGPSAFERLNPARADAIREALKGITAEGTSNPVEVVRVASNLFGSRNNTDAGARMVWFADGMASAGELRPGKLRDAMSQIASAQSMRVTLVGVGGDTDVANLDAMTSGLGAVHVSLDPAMTTTGHALSVLGTLYGDLLTDVAVELPPTAEAVYPRGYKTVAPGDEVVLMGRVKGPLAGEVKLTGKLRGELWSATYPIELAKGSSANSFLPKMWAAERIRDLELADATDQDAIVDLSKKYGVLSRFTTLLALESREMMEEYGVRDRKYEKWDGSEGVDSGDVATAEAQTRGKMGPTESEAPAADFEDSAEPMAKPEEQKAQKPARKSAPRSKKMSSSMSDDIFGGGGRGGFEPMPRPRRRHRPRMRRPSVTLMGSHSEATEWELSNVQRKIERLEREPGNRTRTMQVIRAMQRAQQLDEAKARIDKWIATNHMDPEALVQLAQWHSLRGEMDDALVQLSNGVDAAPRGEWVQERAHRAYLAIGQEALACAHGVALRGIQKKPEYDVDDVMKCGIATDMSAFGAGDPEAESDGDEASDAAARKAQIEAEMKALNLGKEAPKPARVSGDLQVEAIWAGQHDLDILVLESTGRPLSWLSQRQRVQVDNVRTNGSESLGLPSMRERGTYRVLLVRADGEGPVSGNVTVTARGRKQTFPFTMAAGETTARIADAEWSYKWR